LSQSQRNDLDPIRRNPEVRNLYQFLEAGLKRPVEPGTLQTVPADTRERKAIARVALIKETPDGNTLTREDIEKIVMMLKAVSLPPPGGFLLASGIAPGVFFMALKS